MRPGGSRAFPRSQRPPCRTRARARARASSSSDQQRQQPVAGAGGQHLLHSLRDRVWVRPLSGGDGSLRTPRSLDGGRRAAERRPRSTASICSLNVACRGGFRFRVLHGRPIPAATANLALQMVPMPCAHARTQSTQSTHAHAHLQLHCTALHCTALHCTARTHAHAHVRARTHARPRCSSKR